MRSSRPAALVAGAAVAGLALLTAGCGSSSGGQRPGTVSAAATALRARALLGTRVSFTGTYAVAAAAGTQASVAVYVTPTAYRVDVVEPAGTASLYGGTTRAATACTTASGKPPVCYSVAAAGAVIPAAFDAGVQRVFTRDLPTLAATSAGFGITEQRPPAAVLALASTTRCFVVTHAGTAQPDLQPVVALVDDGTYCLDASGLPIRLTFRSGTLTLTRHTDTGPTVGQLTPPVSPVPLPSGADTSTSTGPSVPVVLPTGSAG